MFSHVLHQPVAATGVGLVAFVDAEVDEGPTVAVQAASVSGLEFRVYDPTNTTFLGTIQERDMGRWTDELNGKGLGRLTARLSDQTVKKNKTLLQDDNVIRAHFRNEDRFAWRVRAGEENLIQTQEGPILVGLDGPGGLDALEEGIVFPEFPLTTDPIKDSTERFFGYMSKAGSTSMQSSDPVYNLVRKPIVTSASDWVAEEGDTTGSASVGDEEGLDNYDTFRWTYSNSGSEELYLRHNGGAAIPVTPSSKVSLAVIVRTSLDANVSLVAEFDTEVLESPAVLTSSGNERLLEFEDITVPPGATTVRLGVRVSDDIHLTGSTVDLSWPVVNTGTRALAYFDGNTPDKSNFINSWTGATNNSTSSQIVRMRTLDNHQPSWFDGSLWTHRFQAVRKGSVKKGTAQHAPEDWVDPTAYLIWPTSPQDPSTPGTVYWRNEFYMPKDGAVFLQASADNQLRVWLDGVEVITQGFNGDATDIVGSWDGVLKKGTHLIAAETTNFKSFSPGNNYGWFLASVMYKVNNQPVGVVTHTDKTWLSYFEGDTNVPYKDTTSSKTVVKKTTTEKKVPVKYKVRSGDYLTKIAAKYGIKWRDIYNANKSMIDARAARSGLPNKGPGWWIFPGQILTIPGKYTTTSVTSSVPTTVKTTKRTWSAGEPLTTKQPGWYPYQILAQLVTEAKNRKVEAFKNMKLGFEFGRDSNGDPWDTGFEAVVDRSFRLGDSVYSAAQQLVEGGMDIRMAPDFTLNAYAEMGEYRGINNEPQDMFQLYDKGGTTLTYRISKRTDLKRFILIDTDQGWRTYSNLEADESGRSETGASLGGVNADKISQAIGEELEALGKKTKTVTTKFLIVDGRTPYVDFDLGDVVAAKDIFGRNFDVRITALTVEESEGALTCEVVASGEGL